MNDKKGKKLWAELSTVFPGEFWEPEGRPPPKRFTLPVVVGGAYGVRRIWGVPGLYWR